MSDAKEDISTSSEIRQACFQGPQWPNSLPIPYGATLQISSLSFKVPEIHSNDRSPSGTVFPA